MPTVQFWSCPTANAATGSVGHDRPASPPGGVKWVESLAREMSVATAFVLKRRLTEDRTEVTAVSAQVKGEARGNL